MGRGVALNANTFNKMTDNGVVYWNVPIGNGFEYNFKADRREFTVQLAENSKPTHFKAFKLLITLGGHFNQC